MYDHSSSVYNNSCLNVPKNGKNNFPVPVYEQRYLNQLRNEATKLSLTSNEIKMKSKKLSARDKEAVKSMVDFYDSIPEYEDINHLSDKDFYKKIEDLKQRQRTFFELLQREINFSTKDIDWIDDYKKMTNGQQTSRIIKNFKSTTKPFCTTPILNKSHLNKNLDDVESIDSLDKDILKPPSRRSVRIETPSDRILSDNTPEPFSRPKSRIMVSSAGSQRKSKKWDDFNLDDLNLDLGPKTPQKSTSEPSSPRKSKAIDDLGITIPKPFQMTVRDEENKIVDELLTNHRRKESKSEMFKAHDVPIESQIPLFDKIMADQERKNFLVRERRKAALQSQMRPFSFTKRDEEIQEITRRLSKSSPCLYFEDVPQKVKKFKARPIPRNLFSNYIYKKMHEDDFYRALQKKIRAEELLKSASLPPSMAKREKTRQKYDVCPRSFRDLESEKPSPTNLKKTKRIPNFKVQQDRFEKELEELKNEFISTSPRPFKLKTAKRANKKVRKGFRNSSASSKSSDSRDQSSLELQAVSRSNLAAVLRIQSARRKLEMDMLEKLEEAKLKEEARWREKIMRKKPVWQALAYSHEEDLAMRLQLRRDEERLRNEEHRLRMQLMLGRVNQQPTLYERQSQAKFPRTRDELIDELYKEYGTIKRNSKRSINDFSGSLPIKMKDEAIQAYLERSNSKSSDDSVNSKESSQEEKEKCDCSSSDDNEKSNQ